MSYTLSAEPAHFERIRTDRFLFSSLSITATKRTATLTDVFNYCSYYIMTERFSGKVLIRPGFRWAFASDTETRRDNPEALIAAVHGIAEVIELMGKEHHLDEKFIGQERAITGIIEDFRQINTVNEQSQINVSYLNHELARMNAATVECPLYVLTERDLFIPFGKNNFVFGATTASLGVSTQSIKRFRDYHRDPRWIAATAQHIARHEFGHLVGLNEATIKHLDQRGGIALGHCAVVPCTMNQIMSVEEAGQLIFRLEGRPNAGFCRDCVGALAILGAQR